jgi:hypothetical protein
MARRNLRERFDAATRPADLVDSFLLDWHTQTPANTALIDSADH